MLIIIIKRLPEPVSDRKLIKRSHGGTTSKSGANGPMSVLSRPRALLKYFDRAAQMLSKQMHAVCYYVLIKLPGREIGAVLAMHKPLGLGKGRVSNGVGSVK